MRRSVLVVAPFFALAVAAACVGSDPAAPVVQADATSPEVDGAPTSPEPTQPTHGIFLTSKLYGTDFLAHVGGDVRDGGDTRDAGALRAYVDQLCVAAATSAQLPNPDHYIAVMAAEPAAQNRDEQTGLFGALTVDAGRWCPVTNVAGDASVACDDGTVIFASPKSLLAGPEHPLTHDERGNDSTAHPFGKFLSGLVVDASATSVFESRVRNCLAWSAPEALDAGVDAARAEVGFGRIGESSALWLVSAAGPCDGTYWPLLCIER